MIRIFDIALKDLVQLSRDFKTFMFLLIMPIVFTLLFGYAFGGFGGAGGDARLPVGFLDHDRSRLSKSLREILQESKVIRLDEDDSRAMIDLENLIGDNKVAAAVIVPADYGKITLDGKSAKLIFIGDTASPAGTTIQSEIISAVSRLDSAVRTALIMEEVAKSRAPFDYAFKTALDAWHKPPIAVKETTSTVIRKDSNQVMSLAHTSPGMMLQFAIVGLLTAAQVIVAERKSRAMQRLLTTATARLHILLGHYAAIFSLIFTQFIILILFGQVLLKVDYLRDVPATFLVAFTAALCIAALGLLIGTLAHSDEQAVIFSLIPMFLFSGLGGAWVPLEVTGATFQAIGHVSPVAWAMDGFKNIITRGFGLDSVLMPAAALTFYGGIFFALAAWRLHRAED